MSLFSYALYVEELYQQYIRTNAPARDDKYTKRVACCQRLKEIREDLCVSELPQLQRDKRHEEEIRRYHRNLKQRGFVCKIKRIAVVGDLMILAEFYGEYYRVIRFERYMDQFPDLQILRDADIFQKIHPDEYHVFFGGRFENGVSASFIWHYGDPIGDKIKPDKVEWMEEINDDLYNR